MIKLLITRFWPVLLPLAIYLVWILRRRTRARARGEAVPPLTDGPLAWVVMASLGLLILCFVILGISAAPVTGTYVPPHMEGGKIEPAKVVP